MPQHEPRAARHKRAKPSVGWAAAILVAAIVGLTALPGGARDVLAATTQTFVATADAYVKASSPTKNYGTATTLQVRAPTPEYRVYLRFNVTGLTGSVTAAKVRLFVTDPSPFGGQVKSAAAGWTETGITWTNAPAPGGILGTAAAVTTSTWAEIALTPAAFSGNGQVNLAITSTNTNSVIYSSRQGANPPQLVLTTDATPTAAPTATATATTAPTATATATLPRPRRRLRQRRRPRRRQLPPPRRPPHGDRDSDGDSDSRSYGHRDRDRDGYRTAQRLPRPRPRPLPRPPRNGHRDRDRDGDRDRTATATETATATATATAPATVAPPVVSFSATQDTGSLRVLFADTSMGNPDRWTWDFGDGSPPDTTQNPGHDYAAAGTYPVKLTAGDGAWSGEATAQVIVVDPAATATPTESPTAYGDGDSHRDRDGHSRRRPQPPRPPRRQRLRRRPPRPSSRVDPSTPVNCTGYGQSRVYLETQAWWTQPGDAVEGMSRHIHLGTCFPLHQTLSGTVPFDLHIQLHMNPGVLSQVDLQVFGNNVNTTQIAANPNFTCPTSQCDLWYHLDYDTTRVPADGSLEFRFHAVVLSPDGKMGYTSTGWQAVLANGGRPVQTYRTPTFIEARGWYTDTEYENARVTTPLPTGPVSGTWSIGLRLAAGSGGTPADHVLVTVDPKFHADPVDRGQVVFERTGSFTGVLAIDTRTLSNGPHRLVMRTDSTIAAGVDSGVLVIGFRVDNGAIGVIAPLVQTVVAQTSLALAPWLAHHRVRGVAHAPAVPASSVDGAGRGRGSFGRDGAGNRPGTRRRDQAGREDPRRDDRIRSLGRPVRDPHRPSPTGGPGVGRDAVRAGRRQEGASSQAVLNEGSRPAQPAPFASRRS